MVREKAGMLRPEVSKTGSHILPNPIFQIIPNEHSSIQQEDSLFYKTRFDQIQKV